MSGVNQEWDEEAMCFRRVFWNCPTCGDIYHQDEPTCETCQCECGALLNDLCACPVCDAPKPETVSSAPAPEVKS